MEVMGCQVNAIGEAIKPLFADPVTYNTCDDCSIRAFY